MDRESWNAEMEILRKYGQPPYEIAVVHGGPGAAGEMAPVARELSASRGVLEPFQTAATVEGQKRELKAALERHATGPVDLVGYSWGAWLAFILAAHHPELVRKIVLVASGPFEAKYAEGIFETRMGRLNEADRFEVDGLMSGDGSAFKTLGALLSHADTYSALPGADEAVELREEIYRAVWPEASELRKSGRLLEMGRNVQCPVIAIHGDYDPHPAEGVRAPLSRVVKDFQFILLHNCGHKPWIEREARNPFYEILKRELA